MVRDLIKWMFKDATQGGAADDQQMGRRENDDKNHEYASTWRTQSPDKIGC